MLTVLSAHTRAAIDRLRTDDGAGIVEYVLLIVAIALVVLLAMVLLSNSLSTAFSEIGSSVTDAPG